MKNTKNYLYTRFYIQTNGALAANKEQYHETKRINLLRARERGGRDGNGVSFVTKPEDKQNTKIKPVKSRRQKSQNTKKRVKAFKDSAEAQAYRWFAVTGE